MFPKIFSIDLILFDEKIAFNFYNMLCSFNGYIYRLIDLLHLFYKKQKY